MKRILLSAAALGALYLAKPAIADDDAVKQGVKSATQPTLANIVGGPWTLAQGPASKTQPYLGYCINGLQTNNSLGTAPMQPYYFPHMRRLDNGILQGFFDYRPRNAQEAVVVATSRDEGRNWTFQQKALALDTACPVNIADGDNVKISNAGGPSVANEVFDNGQGHPVVLTIGDQSFLYTLDRSNANIDVAGLIVHPLLSERRPLKGFARVESVGVVDSNGNSLLKGTADSQGLVPPSEPLTYTTGLLNPDTILGAFQYRRQTTVLYVSKIRNGDKTGPTALPTTQQCSATPSFAISPGRAANSDFVTVRVATTKDGIHFKDRGAVSGLSDPTTVDFAGIRYLGSGDLIPLADADGNPNGRYGLVFGAGNCLDGDSDGFHFIGYAETTTPGDLMHWKVLNGVDNPIISTGQVTNPATGRVYPANKPVADQSDWPTPATNFYYGRSYGPTVAYLGKHKLTVIFAGYNTPQPKNNLGNYRSIGVTTLKLKSNIAPF